MIESLLANLETLLLVVFAFSALVGAALMIILRRPIRVAMALVSTMIFLGGIYGLLGVHFIAAFQVLIYVGAVMVFMVYVIMLLDPRDPAYRGRYSSLLFPGLLGFAALLGLLAWSLWPSLRESPESPAAGGFGMQQFARAFLSEYWLHFELTSVLLLAAVIAAIAVIKVAQRDHA